MLGEPRKTVYKINCRSKIRKSKDLQNWLPESYSWSFVTTEEPFCERTRHNKKPTLFFFGVQLQPWANELHMRELRGYIGARMVKR